MDDPEGPDRTWRVALAAARRECTEDTGLAAPTIERPLTPLRQAGGKQVICGSAEGDLDLTAFAPGAFKMEWPLRSGKPQTFLELDRVAYFSDSEALDRILPSHAPLIRESLRFLTEGT